MKLPARQTGGNVVDLGQYIVGSLQDGVRTLRQSYNRLVDSCRENLSTQKQVQQSVLTIIKAQTLEQLLEVITVDLQALFGVDVVRLAMESEIAGYYDVSYSEYNYSGVSFIDVGMVAEVLGEGRNVLLCSDTVQDDIPGFSSIFADCAGLVNSCALLRLELPQHNKHVLLAFGTKKRDHFNENQATDLLDFLAQIVEQRLDYHLQQSGIESLL
jgi:uncharacterized protein YigA (DUF484 family)